MRLQAKLDSLHRETVLALCWIQEFPEGVLPHTVYVEEETERSLDCGNSVYNAYNLIKIFPDETCILENPETGREEKRLLSEINTDWLITVWTHYVDVSGIQEIEDNRAAELLQQMRPIASALITGRYITDFTVHDTRFIRRTNAGRPFIWLVYKSGTHIYAMDDAKEIRNFLEMLDYYERYSKSDFYLYRYDGSKLFPIFPKITRTWIKNELQKIPPIKNKSIMEEIGISATPVKPFRGYRNIVLICQVAGKWLVRICGSGLEIEVYEDEFVLD